MLRGIDVGSKTLTMNSVAIVSASDDKYLSSFEGMLLSLGRKLADFDVNVIDLSFSKDEKTCIEVIKPDTRFALAGWKDDFLGRNKNTGILESVLVQAVYSGCLLWLRRHRLDR